MDNINDLNKAQLKLAKDFIGKRVNEKDYMKRRGKYKTWEEAEFLAQDSRTFNLLLQQLRRVFRVNLMRELNELDIKDIIKMITHGITKSNSSISNYFNYAEEKMEQESRPQRVAQLAIILDIPYLFALQDKCDFYHEQENFTEYKITNADIISKEEIEKYISPIKYRDVTGVGIINRQSLFPFLTEITYVRIDRRQSFFTIEFFIKESIEIFPHDKLVEINKSLNLKYIHNALLTTAFLRNGYTKLILIGSYENIIPVELQSYVEKMKRRKRTLEFHLYL